MQFILNFVQKNKHLLLFLGLELIALMLTIQYHSFNKSKFINSANTIAGGTYDHLFSLRSYFFLKKENKILAEENIRLRNQIEKSKQKDTFLKDSLFANEQVFRYTSAEIINNDFYKTNNYITLNKGDNHGVYPNMAVVNSKGVVGIVTNTSSHYSSAISLLNRNFRTNAKVKNQDYFGTVLWNGMDKSLVQLIDIPREAILKKGDTIMTGGRSAIFPKGIFIGSVQDYFYDPKRGYKNIQVKLFNNITQVTQVYLIKNLHKEEISRTEQLGHE